MKNKTPPEHQYQTIMACDVMSCYYTSYLVTSCDMSRNCLHAHSGSRFQQTFPTIVSVSRFRQCPARLRQSFPTMVRSFPTIFSVNRFRQWPDCFRQFRQWSDRFRQWPDRFWQSFLTKAVVSANGFRQRRSLPTIVSDNGQIVSFNRFRQQFPAMARSLPTIVSDNGQIVSDNRF